VTDFPKG
jgi:hypothetical protein